MSDEQDLKLACLHHAGGDLDHAKALFEWVSGSVRATTDSEAPEVSAPDQDKPEEPFNYRHPSKFGTDIPRRCHLEELTPEERAIRDLVGTVESLGAHPLLTTTVIQLMKAGESLADWVDIELRDKAISALQSLSSGEGGVGLLDGEPEPVPTEVRTQDEQDAGLPTMEDIIDPELTGGVETVEYLYRLHTGTPEAPPSPEVASEQGGEGADVPEEARDEMWVPPAGYTYIPTQGERCVCINLMQDGIGNFFCCNKRGEASADAERIENDRQGTPSIEQSPEAYDPINKGEEPIIHPEAPFWGKALTSEAQADAKAEPKKFGGIFGFGAKKTLVGEGV